MKLKVQYGQLLFVALGICSDVMLLQHETCRIWCPFAVLAHLKATIYPHTCIWMIWYMNIPQNSLNWFMTPVGGSLVNGAELKTNRNSIQHIYSMQIIHCVFKQARRLRKYFHKITLASLSKKKRIIFTRFVEES